jgi:DNA-binding winged helix-turn-helix (wHTH) protein/Tol biopolymer transport system component
MHDLPRYAFGDFALDTGRVQLLRDGEPVALEPKAFAVLRLLAERAPHVVDKAEIFSAVWKDTAVTDNALTRVVAQLRKALGDDARDPRYIATVSTRGYRLLPPVETSAPGGVRARALPTVPDAAPAPTPEPAPAPSRERRRRWPVSIAAGLFLAGAAGAWLATRAPDTAATGGRSIGDLDLAVAASLRAEQMTVATGYDGHVAFAPDGATIAYSSDRSGAFEIYVEGLAEGSMPSSLTRGAGQAIQPAWSPDGRLIAYHDLARGGLWIVPSRGGEARKIAENGARPSWSADGRHVVFQSRSPADLNPGGSFGSDSTIGIVAADGRSAPRALTTRGQPVGSHGHPQWWPGGRRVVFAVSAPSGIFLGAALWTVDVETGALARLSADPRLSSEFTVPADGRGVLFAARHTTALWWLPVTAGGDGSLAAGEARPTALPVNGPSISNLAISVDSRRVAWTAGTSSSSIVAASIDAPASAAATALVPSTEIGWKAGNPVVSDTGRIAFIGNRGNAGSKIFLVEPGRSPRQLTTDGRDHFSPFWITGRGALAVLADHGDGLGWWLVDPETGRERPLFPLAAIPKPPGVQAQIIGPSVGQAVSPDFSRLAVAYVRDGIANLWTAPLGDRGPTGTLVQRTFEPESGAFGSWSADGRRLAYQCGRGADTQICVIDAEGAQPARQLTREAGTNFTGEWIGNEEILIASRQDGLWNVRRVHASSGTVTDVTAFRDPRCYVRYPRWDPTRRRVLFERHETSGRLWTLELPAVSAAGSPAKAPAR